MVKFAQQLVIKFTTLIKIVRAQAISNSSNQKLRSRQCFQAFIINPLKIIGNVLIV